MDQHVTRTCDQSGVVNQCVLRSDAALLDVLSRSKLFETYATFFVVGELLEFKPELLDKILENGHEIGFHTMYHSRLDSDNFQEKFSPSQKHVHIVLTRQFVANLLPILIGITLMQSGYIFLGNAPQLYLI